MVALHLKATEKVLLPHSDLPCETLQRLSPTSCFPHQVVRANNRRQVARASPHDQMARASPRVQVVRATPHVQMARANNRRQVAKAKAS